MHPTTTPHNVKEHAARGSFDGGTRLHQKLFPKSKNEKKTSVFGFVFSLFSSEAKAKNHQNARAPDHLSIVVILLFFLFSSYQNRGEQSSFSRKTLSFSLSTETGPSPRPRRRSWGRRQCPSERPSRGTRSAWGRRRRPSPRGPRCRGSCRCPRRRGGRRPVVE